MVCGFLYFVHCLCSFHILLQLGGLNSMLTTEHGLNIPMISKAPAMMLGIDMLHGSPARMMCLLFLSELLHDFYTSSGKRKPDQIIVFR
ncbi:hypothetical protein GIB67_023724 [Kingdonia uniflora]|uniref:Secreted protein n=1 Tax=Kingdonia uniflora TaxID=39325 RepID=A0A7J7MGG0_9MAGN|nr:hypothetical protein GIB67_023724 [Kingdonia uniflora]